MERKDIHATPDTIRQLLRAKLPREELAGVIRHLLARCPACLLAAGQAFWAERQSCSRRAYEQVLREAEGAMQDFSSPWFPLPLAAEPGRRACAWSAALRPVQGSGKGWRGRRR